MRLYNVELTISGKIATEGLISFQTDKELRPGDIFNSHIKIKSHNLGCRISATVFTENQERAYKVGLLFIGRMLDVLSARINTSLLVFQNDIRPTIDKNVAKAVVDEDEFRTCFEISRNLNLNLTPFLTGLNWYRKGLYTEDPFDKFLAFWNAISIVAATYHTRNERTRGGIINQIWNCFETLWGTDLTHWPFINGNNRWINDNNAIRDNIAHGLIPADISNIENVIDKIGEVRNVAHHFLTTWTRTQFNISILR